MFVQQRKPWWMIGSRVMGNPFSSLGLDWCQRCRMEVDTDTFCEHAGTTFTYRRNCQRCGAVIKYGIFDNVALITHRPLPKAALAWVHEPIRDRR